MPRKLFLWYETNRTHENHQQQIAEEPSPSFGLSRLPSSPGGTSKIDGSVSVSVYLSVLERWPANAAFEWVRRWLSRVFDFIVSGHQLRRDLPIPSLTGLQTL